jgi:serine phosphatase RsbU (regulator of sigma subunit)
MHKKILIILFILFLPQFSIAQVDDKLSPNFASKREFAEYLYNKANDLYDNGDLDSSLFISQQALTACEEVGLLQGVAYMLLNVGIIHRIWGDYHNSLKHLYMSLEHFQTLNAKEGIASTLNQIGSIYRIQGNYPGALEYFLNSLSLSKQLKDTLGEATALNNIGIVYFYQNNFQKALEYYLQSLEIELLLGTEYGVSISYINIGEVYKKMGNYKESLDYFLKALVLAKKHKEYDKDGDSVGILYNEIGSIYLSLGEIKLSETYLERALKIFEPLNSQQRLAECKLYLGELAIKKNNTNKAKELFLQALNHSKSISALDLIAESNKFLSIVYEKSGNAQEAFNYYKQYIYARDSLFNEDNMKRMVQTEMLYEFDKQMQETRLEQAKLDVKAQESIQRQRLIRNFLIFAFLSLLIFSVWIYRAYKSKQIVNKQLWEQKQEIVEKNEELVQQQEEIMAQRDEIEKKNIILEQSQLTIEAKNDRIISSIEYAQTIQQAILPDKEQLSKFFPEHTILFLPKDIVSGDFYWISSIDNLLYAAVIDCTGHGVPGAFMSLIGNTMLNQIVNEWQTRDPAMILELMHMQVRRLLNQETIASKAHASMDICLVSIDTNKKRATFAGASRPLFIIQNGAFTKIAGDPRSVGGFQREEKRYFTNHDIDISTSTYLYLTSDGYMDQMNNSYKKFGQRQLTDLLTEIHLKPNYDQSLLLQRAFESHRMGHEQIDDICILGLKV